MPQKSKTIKPLAAALPKLMLTTDLNRLTSKDLSSLLGVSARTVKDYLDGGAPWYTNENGVRYIQWSEFLPWYMDYIQSGRGAYKGSAVQGAEQKRLVTRNDLNDADLRFKEIKIQDAQVELEKKLGQLIPKEELDFALTHIVLTCRSEMLRLPDMVVARLQPGLTDARKRQLVEIEVNKALTDMTASIARLIEGSDEDSE